MKKEVAAIDLGTSTICVALARCENNSNKKKESSVKSNNNIKVLGAGYQMTKGLSYGTLTNMEDLEGVLLSAIATAEKEAQKRIKHVTMALPNWATESIIMDNSISIGNTPISNEQINKLIDLNNSKYCPQDSTIIHIFPLSYNVDDSEGIRDPIGLLGNKLSAVFNVISVKYKLINNLTKCLNQCGIMIDNFICSAYASAMAVAMDDEIQSGVMVIDMGGSSTTISCVSDNALLYMGIVPIGGSHITKDISVVLRTNKTNAERLKILYGISYSNTLPIHDDEQILVSSVDEFGEEHIQNVSKSTLDLIISSRLDELFDLIRKHIEENNIDEKYYQNIIITGGGSQIACFNEYIKARNLFFGSSVRLGKPICIAGSNDLVNAASFSTTAGTILYKLNNNQYNQQVKQTGFIKKMVSMFKKGI
ncbi:MAG: cell division protein FtsA [Alphaproteobacteria bacterium]|nr:cell division protein FtsA [Alphaproteobacteria bacterium]